MCPLDIEENFCIGSKSLSRRATDTSLVENQMATLVPLFAFFAFLSAALLFWCLISSCVGTSIRESLSQLWHYSVLGAMSQDGFRHSRHAYGEEEIWEMEYRGRAG